MSSISDVPRFGPPTAAPLPERLYAKVRFIPTSLAFAWACVRGQPIQLWIGDSHAMSFIRDIVNSYFLRGHEGQFIARAGARLMYSIARKGFSPVVSRVAGFAERFARPGAIVPFFVAGEIDVRAHLVSHPDDFGFVEEYVDRCAVVARQVKAAHCYFVVPPPPVDLDPDESWYPIVGTAEERVVVHTRLREALREATDRSGYTILLDFTELLADETGAMPLKYTEDGCHTNADRVAAIKAALAERDLLNPR